MVASSIAQVMGWISIGSVCLLVAGTPLYIAVSEFRARAPKTKSVRAPAVDPSTATSAA